MLVKSKSVLRRGTALLLASIIAPQILAAGSAEAFDSPLGTTRLEERTPPGKVPPPPATPRPGASAAQEQPSIAVPDIEKDDIAARSAAIIDAFEAANKKAGSPRIAVYFNRELSDEIREWIPGDRHQSTVEVSQTVSGNSIATGPVNGQATTSVKTDARSQFYVGVTGGRDDPRETWKWEFEDAITDTLLQGNASIIDRAVIFRLMAKQSPQTAGLDGSASTTLNEISALGEFADILVEMKVKRTSSAVGYDFRATAKSVKTGRILGSAYVSHADDEHNTKRRWAATDRGYEVVGVESDLTVDTVAREITLKLMESMAPQLGK